MKERRSQSNKGRKEMLHFLGNSSGEILEIFEALCTYSLAAILKLEVPENNIKQRLKHITSRLTL